MNSTEATMVSRLIPGFSSYANEQKRRDDDLAIRGYLVERIQDIKKKLHSFTLPFLTDANFKIIHESESLRLELEYLQAKLRSASEGYSALFDKNRVDEKKLAAVLDADKDLIALIDKLESSMQQLDKQSPDFSSSVECTARIRERIARRKEILSS